MGVPCRNGYPESTTGDTPTHRCHDRHGLEKYKCKDEREDQLGGCYSGRDKDRWRDKQ